MAGENDLKEGLLAKDVEANPKLFSLRPDELRYSESLTCSWLFERDNIESKASLAKFKAYGGNEGLLIRLKTSTQVPERT